MTTIADAYGNTEQEFSYGSVAVAEPVEASDRGYTGHEHITHFGLINMNGRCYDPMVSGFLSVDAYLQDPTSAQGFNRYAYCAYNPLRYTDPTGWYMGPTDDNEGDGDGSDSGNSSAGVVITPDSFTDYGYGWYSVGYSNGGVGGVYCWNNWKSTFSDVPSTHGQGTTYSDPSYYYPTISHNNGSNGHGTGGNIGGNGHGNSTKAISSYGLTLIGTYTSIQKDNWQNPATRSQKQLNQKRAYEIQKELKQQGVQKYVKDIKADRISKFKTAGYELAVVSLILEGSDVYVCKEIKTSNLVNVGMVIVGLSCWEVALAYAAIDIGSSLITGKSFGEHLDNWIGHPVYKWGD